ncbi:N-acetyltransferase [Actinobaculum sp. 352]|nr:N-acetyltransferase [Actinobaculum sp. 352]
MNFSPCIPAWDGMPTQSPEKLYQAVTNSLWCETAWRDDTLAGLVRVVGDDVSIAYVQDLLVVPELQGQGVGTRLLNDALDRFAHVRQFVLITDDDAKTLAFYARSGLGSAESAAVRCLLRG